MSDLFLLTLKKKVQKVILEFHTAQKEQDYDHNHGPVQDVTEIFSSFDHPVVPLFAFIGAHRVLRGDRFPADLTMGVLRYLFSHDIQAQQYDTS